MFINLSEAFTSKGCVLEERFVPELTEIQLSGTSYRVTACKPFTVKASYVKDGKAVLEMKGSFCAQLFCDRCLQPVEREIAIAFEQDVYAPDAVPDTMDADEQLFLEGYQLNVQALINHEAVINWPSKVLCREDCKGLCAKCGRNLNEGECGCDPFVPDPRMAAVKDIFSANKEV